jgi:hypothetical protein
MERRNLIFWYCPNDEEKEKTMTVSESILTSIGDIAARSKVTVLLPTKNITKMRLLDL